MDKPEKNSFKYDLHNPLGVIGFFITVCYGITVIVFEKGLTGLESPAERLPFVYFIVLFPLVFLVFFIFLVCRHHEKLYGPSDFKDESNFVKLSGYEKMLKYKAAAADLMLPACRLPQPDAECSERKDRDYTFSLLMYSMEHAVHLAIRKLGAEYGVALTENGKYGKYYLDAYGEKNGTIYIAECKFLRGPLSDSRFMDHYRQVAAYVKLFPGRKVVAVLVYILEHSCDGVKEDIVNYSKMVQDGITVKIYVYDSLKKEFRDGQEVDGPAAVESV